MTRRKTDARLHSLHGSLKRDVWFLKHVLYLSQGNCNFDAGTMCSWRNLRTNNFDWLIGSGKTGSQYTGPSSDHTQGSSTGQTGKYYMYSLKYSPNWPHSSPSMNNSTHYPQHYAISVFDSGYLALSHRCKIRGKWHAYLIEYQY